MIKILAFLLSISIVSYSFSQVQKVSKKDLKKLFKTMKGEFSSGEQSKNDTDYFHIMLRMKPIELNKDGYWFYVEQSMFKAQERPYRQRVYHLYIDNDTTIVSKVYEIKNPKQYIKGWDSTAKLGVITADSLVDRQGCSIYLHKQLDGTFAGSTPGKECLSTMRGATYATSEVTVYKDKLISWDRGWSKEDKHLWGAEKGGYIFIKERKF